jgi:diguanylate cyclase (GGDEF)-like protein
VQFADKTDQVAVINTNIFLSAMCAVTVVFAWVNEARNRYLFELEIELERLATTDPLSNAFNRRHFTKSADIEIARSVRHGHALALLMLDIDHFKSINDTYGHHVGDLAIYEFAETCRKLLRRSDVLGRMGGEEFAVFLPETPPAGALHIAQRLCEQISQLEMPTEKGPLKFTVSVGVGIWRGNDDTLGELLQRADAALYEAKHRGRNQVVVSETVAK